MSISEISLQRGLREITNLPQNQYSLQEKDYLKKFLLFVAERFTSNCLKCNNMLDFKWNILLDHENEKCPHRYILECNHCGKETSIQEYCEKMYKKDFPCICNLIDIDDVLRIYDCP